MKIDLEEENPLLSILEEVAEKTRKLITYIPNHMARNFREPYDVPQLYRLKLFALRAHKSDLKKQILESSYRNNEMPEKFKHITKEATYYKEETNVYRPRFKKQITLKRKKLIIEHLAKNAVAFETGLCDECSATACCLLLERADLKDKNIVIERVACAKFPHCFVVVNRKKCSDLNDMRTWGNDCYILDAWLGKHGKVFHVANEISKLVSEKKYTSKQLNDVVTEDQVDFRVLYSLELELTFRGSIGVGHSKEWINSRNNKQQPIDISEFEFDEQRQIKGKSLPSDLDNHTQVHKKKEVSSHCKKNSSFFSKNDWDRPYDDPVHLHISPVIDYSLGF